MRWLLALSLLASPAARYPPRWWEPIPEAQKASWEVLPQQAVPGEVVLSKRNELGLLSNFAPTPFELDGVRYASIEGLWQSLLYPEGPDDPRARLGPWPHTREEVRAMTAFDAKGAGSAAAALLAPAGIHWVTYRGERLDYKAVDAPKHLALIRRAMEAKLRQNRAVRDVLLSTGDLRLIPDHVQPKDKTPAYDYHLIWMGLREALREEERARANKALAHWSPDARARIYDAVEAALARKDRAAAFDGDGTLWHADVPREFLEFQIAQHNLKFFDYSQDAAHAGQRLYDTCKSDVSICIAQAAYLHVGLSVAELERQMDQFYAPFGPKIFPGQVELTRYLKDNGFELYLVSGGPKWLAQYAGRKWFDIPPAHVLGVETRVVDGVLSAEVMPPVPFREGKTQAIDAQIGKDRLLIAAGNTSSDIPMLERAQLLAIAIHSFPATTPGFHYAAEQALQREIPQRGWLSQGW